MCFSATASFGASLALAVVAAASFRKASITVSYVVACIPLFFAIQQAFEWLMWISLCQPAFQRWQGIAKIGFLVFATVVWPILLPMIAWMLEGKGARKKIFFVLWGLGTGVGLYFLFCLFAYSVTPIIQGRHIRYEFHFPNYNKDLMTAVYVFVTVIPTLLSRVTPLRWFGALLLLSLCITGYFYEGYLISVWCYFAATLSIVSFLIIWHLERWLVHLKPRPDILS